MSINIKDNITGNLVDVDSNNNLKIMFPTTLSAVGYTTVVSDVDDGDVTGTRLMRQTDISYDYRLRASYDKIVFQDIFAGQSVNTGRYIVVSSTMTTATSSGEGLILNSGNAIAASNVTRVQSYRSFSLYGTYPLVVDIKAKFSAIKQIGSVVEFGLGIASTTVIPTDGVFFRMTAGVLYGVLNNNSTETQVDLAFIPSANTFNHYSIVAGFTGVRFWIDGVLRGVIDIPKSLGAPTLSNSLPVLFRNYNSIAVLTAVQFVVGQISVTSGDMDSGKDWATTMVGNHSSSISIPGGTSFSANYANSAAPASATLSNTIGGYSNTILGGQWQFAAVSKSETDYALFAYLNPVGTNAIPGKNLIITGIRIDSYVTVAAIATTPTVLQWSIGVGSTSVSLQITDNATIPGTKTSRRILLGIQSFAVGTAVGAQCDRTIDIKFASPLIVEPGTYCHVILKIPVGTNTATQIIRGICMINGYFE